MPRLILASTSPYRRQLLERLRLDFEVRPTDVDETARRDEDASSLAGRLATAKAAHARAEGSRDELLLGADQVAALNGQLLRKPGDQEKALAQLRACQGQTVLFYTATTVIDSATGTEWHGLDRTEVEFRDLPRSALTRYLEIEQPYDCAGGFKAEGLGIALFRSIRSEDPTALLGLPLIWLSQTLRELGFDPLDSSSRR